MEEPQCSAPSVHLRGSGGTATFCERGFQQSGAHPVLSTCTSDGAVLGPGGMLRGRGGVLGVSQGTGHPQARQSRCWAPHRAAPLANKSTMSPRKKVRFQFTYSPAWETAALIPPLTAFVKKKEKFFHLLICSFRVISFLINRIKYRRSSYSLFESFCVSRGSLAHLGHREPAGIFSPAKSLE